MQQSCNQNRRFVHLLSLIALFISHHLIGQDYSLVTTPNPEVSSLVKYVLTPVSKYTGVVNTDIPLYSVQSGSVRVPISVGYHSGGIMVSEEASIVGLGWALNAGGMITRNIAGKDDFEWYIGKAVKPDVITDHERLQGDEIVTNNNCEVRSGGVLRKYLKPDEDDFFSTDMIPDMFHYNFNGHTGSFVLDVDGKPHFSEKSDLRIYINEFSAKAITPDGNIYYFDKTQKLTDINSSLLPPITTWLLTKIEGTDGRTVDFHYKTFSKDIRLIPPFSQSFTLPSSVAIPGGATLWDGTRGFKQNGFRLTEQDNVQLSKITCDNLEVRFIYSADGVRQDIENSHRLDAVEVYSVLNGVSSQIREWDFEYSYFGTAKGLDPGYNWPSNDYSGLIPSINGSIGSDIGIRLKLDAITENQEKTYSFEYNECGSSCPTKTSLSQDYWGLFNNVKNDQGSFIPDVPISVIGKQAKRYATANADVFMLKKITYPTKGYKEFKYELNTYSNKAKDKKMFDKSGNYYGFDSYTGSGVGPGSGTVLTFPVALSGNKSTTMNVFEDISRDFEFVNFVSIPTIPVVIKYNFTVFNLDDYDEVWDVPAKAWLEDENGSKVPNSTIYFYDLKDHEAQFPLGQFIDGNGNPIAGNKIVGRSHELTFQLPPDKKYTVHAAFGSSIFKDFVGFIRIEATYDQSFEKVTNDDGSVSTPNIGYGGGVRISEITEYEQDGTELLKSRYKYHFDDKNGIEKSSGRLFTMPRHSVDAYSLASLIFTTNFDVVFSESIARTIASSTSQNTLSREKGGFVGYDKVVVEQISPEEKNNGYSEFTYFNSSIYDQIPTLLSLEEIEHTLFQDSFHKFPRLSLPWNGLPKSEKHYARVRGGKYKTVSETNFSYKINEVALDIEQYPFLIFRQADHIFGWSKKAFPTIAIASGYGYSCGGHFKLRYHPYYSHLIQEVRQDETIYDLETNERLTTSTEFFYEGTGHYQLSKSTVSNSKGEQQEKHFFYPDDIQSTNSLTGGSLDAEELSAISKMQSAVTEPRIGQVIQTETRRNDAVVMERNNFKTWSFSGGRQQVLTSSIETGTGSNLEKVEITVNAYDDASGNPIEIVNGRGLISSYIWGYNKSYPILKAENAVHADIMSYASDLRAYAESGNLVLFKSKLAEIRDALPHAMITGYTYRPLIGMESKTDPNGETISFEYDSSGRLKKTVDSDGHTLEQYTYQYKN